VRSSSSAHVWKEAEADRSDAAANCRATLPQVISHFACFASPRLLVSPRTEHAGAVSSTQHLSESLSSTAQVLLPPTPMALRAAPDSSATLGRCRPSSLVCPLGRFVHRVELSVALFSPQHFMLLFVEQRARYGWTRQALPSQCGLCQVRPR